jgi:hypothetical protein
MNRDELKELFWNNVSTSIRGYMDAIDVLLSKMSDEQLEELVKPYLNVANEEKEEKDHDR